MIKKITIFILSFFDFFYQKKIINFLVKNCKIETVIDIGAHKGETIKLLLKNFKIKKIISFEASEKNFLILEKNIKKIENKYPQCKIIIENIALGKFNEKKTFKEVSETSSSTFSEINEDSKYFKKKYLFLGMDKKKKYYQTKDIDLITLDSYFNNSIKDNFDLLKIDTEGFEYNILQGFEKNIKKVKNIFFEHHYDDMIKKNYTFSDINNFLIKHNFKMIFKSKMPFRKSFEYIYCINDLS